MAMSQPAFDEREGLVRTIRAQLAVLPELELAPLLAGLTPADLRRVVQALAVLCAAVLDPDDGTRDTAP